MDKTCRSIADTANQLARIYADHCGDLAMALALAHAAAEGAPEESQVDDTLGWILFRSQDLSLVGDYVSALTRSGPATLYSVPVVGAILLVIGLVTNLIAQIIVRRFEYERTGAE